MALVENVAVRARAERSENILVDRFTGIPPDNVLYNFYDIAVHNA
jgi:hypothetical protein